LGLLTLKPLQLDFEHFQFRARVHLPLMSHLARERGRERKEMF